TMEALYRDPVDAVQAAVIMGGDIAHVGAYFNRGSSQPRPADLQGARKLKAAFQACGVDLVEVFLFGEDGRTELSSCGAFQEPKPDRLPIGRQYRRGQHTAPAHVLEGFLGEEIAALYDVLNRSTIARV